MTAEKEIEKVITPIAEEMDYEIVRVMLIGQGRPTLQIMIDNKNQKPIIIDDCVKFSKAISEPLDEKIDYEYNLEVSSPGIDRPLIKPEHYKRFVGFEAKIDLVGDIEGRKRFKGRLVAADDKIVSIDVDGDKYDINYDNIAKAKLVLTDELIKAHEQNVEDNN